MDILKKGSGSVTLPGNNQLILSNDMLKKLLQIRPKNNFSEPIPFHKNTLIQIGNKFIIKTLNEICSPKNSVDIFEYHGFLDASKIGKDAVLRNKRPGDVFCPAGRNGTKTLKKFLNEKKIPPQERDNLVLLASGNTILWIEGLGISEFVKVDKNTKMVYNLDARF
jgi:tRNA(Ile)-lysidine synthase